MDDRSGTNTTVVTDESVSQGRQNFILEATVLRTESIDFTVADQKQKQKQKQTQQS
jgi:hypothetical protein